MEILTNTEATYGISIYKTKRTQISNSGQQVNKKKEDARGREEIEINKRRVLSVLVWMHFKWVLQDVFCLVLLIISVYTHKHVFFPFHPLPKLHAYIYIKPILVLWHYITGSGKDLRIVEYILLNFYWADCCLTGIFHVRRRHHCHDNLKCKTDANKNLKPMFNCCLEGCRFVLVANVDTL